MAEKQKPCPFCGGENLKSKTTIIGRWGSQEYECRVVCQDCGGKGPPTAVSRGGLPNWNQRNDTVEVERLRAEHALAKKVMLRATEETAKERDRLLAEVERLRKVMSALLEVAEDLRGCTHDWDWKYGEYWDGEITKVRAALAGEEEKND